MKTLLEQIQEAKQNQVSLGHFNVSNLETLWGIFLAAQKLNLPVVIGVSEGERDFIGIAQIKALVDSLKQEFNYPIYLNADHTYSLEKVKQVALAGFDSIVVDGAQLSFQDNLNFTSQAVNLIRSINPNILVEAEVGYIGKSSKLLDKIPNEASLSQQLPSPESIQEFVEKTKVDLIAPAVGNLHGMFKNSTNPKLHIENIAKIKSLVSTPIVLHGGSGISDQDFTQAIKAGVSLIHINTEIRLAYRQALEASLTQNPHETSPYKYLQPTIDAVSKVVANRLKLFNHLN